MNTAHKNALKSFIDRLYSDQRCCLMFEGDEDMLRECLRQQDEIDLLNSIVANLIGEEE